MLCLGLRMLHEAYRVGAILFTKFSLVVLDGQVRASPWFNKWLSRLHDPNNKYPIDDAWLNELKALSETSFKVMKKIGQTLE